MRHFKKTGTNRFLRIPFLLMFIIVIALTYMQASFPKDTLTTFFVNFVDYIASPTLIGIVIYGFTLFHEYDRKKDKM